MIITALIVIIGLTSLISYHAFSDHNLFEKLLFSAYRIKHNKEIHRFVSNVLVHADFTHLLFNMFSLYFLGEALEFFLFTEYGNQIGEIHFFRNGGRARLKDGKLLTTRIGYFSHQANVSIGILNVDGIIF